MTWWSERGGGRKEASDDHCRSPSPSAQWKNLDGETSPPPPPDWSDDMVEGSSRVTSTVTLSPSAQWKNLDGERSLPPPPAWSDGVVGESDESRLLSSGKIFLSSGKIFTLCHWTSEKIWTVEKS